MSRAIRANACQICGRPLTSPESLASGVGPVCGGRGYQSRVSGRHGGKSWQGMEAFEQECNPCYSCQLFNVPHKDDEQPVDGGFVVTMEQKSRRFGEDAIGGYCKALRMLVDGNLCRQWTQCYGDRFQPRK